MHGTAIRPRLWARILPIFFILVLSLPAALPAFAANGPDYAVSGGWFYTQTGGGGGNGYSVRDSGTDSNGKTIRFWTEFQRLGGVATLGYPVAEPYTGSDGFNYQPFQRGLLQWHPEIGQALLSNTFEQLSSAAKDDWLLAAKGIPKPIANDNSGGDYNKAVSIRLGWMTNGAIKSFFLSNPNPASIPSWSQNAAIQLYGLPMSAPEQHGPFVTERFQRFAIQLWTDSVTGMPSPGTVVGVLGGDLIKEAGLLPAGAVQVLGPGAAGAPPPVVQAPANPSPAPAPAPAGNYPWYVASVQGWPNCGTTYMIAYTQDAGGSNVYGMTLKSWNDWGNVYIASTNNNGSNGSWNRLIGPGVRPGKWYVEVIDGSGNQASDVATVNFTASCDPNQGALQQATIIFKSH